MRDRWDAASRRGREAVELAERSGKPCGARREPRPAGLERARPGRMQMIERAEELERSLGEQLPWALSPSFVHGMFLFASDRIDEARRQFEDVYERAVAVGDWFGRSTSPGSRRSSSAPGTGRRHASTRAERGSSARRGSTIGEAWGAA